MALSTEKIIDTLCDLIRFDHDAIGAYDEAIDAVTEGNVRSELVTFRGDHQRHVTDLSAMVRGLGGTAPESPSVRGVLRKTMTKIAGLLGTERVLQAMKRNEELMNKQYSERLKLDLPADVLRLLRANYADEQRHLTWVEQALRTRLWEQRPTVPT